MNARYRYRHLIESFCALSGRGNPGKIMQGGAVDVSGVLFSLIYSASVDPDMMFIYCDFGDVPPGRQADAYKALLEVNFFLYDGSEPTFTVSDETGRVLLVGQYPLNEGSSAQELRTLLVDLAKLAIAWRADHFLEKRVPDFGSARARIQGLQWRS